MRHAIESRGLTRMYGRAVGVVEVDLDVHPGESFGFLGPNGSGKTTFIRLALGLIRPTAGRVAVMGHDVAADRMGALGEVGYLPGELGLYPGLTGERTLDALARLHPRPPSARERLCEVLELDRATLRRRVREYSRGMKQKLGLVAALQHDPPLAILDEPTAALDPVIQGRLLGWLAERAAAGRTVVFSSHVLAEVEELCDRVAMIREGRLLLVGPVAELRRARTRAVEVQFAEPVDPTRYAVPGVAGVEVDGARHRFSLAGDPQPLLAALSRLPVTDVSIERASLEDAFRDLYEGPSEAR
ncbi:MAG TPA: ABC transporter ATP-binding protein [Miltoncostaeaceae bacterium]|nr:ABC transporter ATP-binding protein [Miltoncostaeaceae bacterium]